MECIRRSTGWGVLLATLILSVALTSARPRPVSAEAGITPWAHPIVIATGLSHAERPALAYTPDGVGHAVWESDGEIIAATQLPGGPWSVDGRIAYGMSPTLAVDNSGQLHAVFANQFLGNSEIYEIALVGGKWSLPVNISHTSGVSTFPVLAAGPDRILYAAWMDNSPGYWTIYIGTWNGHYWSNEPLPYARGQAPAVAVSRDGTVYVTWQDRVPTPDNPSGVFEIFLSARDQSDWLLPIDISDNPTDESIGVSLTANSDGFAHLAWIEGDQVVQYCYGRGLYWSPPQTVVRTTVVARGPRITTERDGMLDIAWDEGDIVRAVTVAPSPATWPKPTVVAAFSGDLHHVALAALPEGRATIGWVQTAWPGDVQIYESYRASNWSRQLWLPFAILERQ